MDLNFTADELAFRDEVRRFIEQNFDSEMRAAMARTRTGYIAKHLHIRWQKALNEKGWLAPNWPVEYGGPGWTPTQRYIYEQEMSSAGAPIVVPFGPRMLAPVIMKFGTEAQKKKYLPDILASNTWWCQGYSEPGAGSDLASLQMKAEDKGDHFLCNGSKIWTSEAQHADMIFCLVRTAQTKKPQEGISFLLIDMKSPGVTVSPIVTIDEASEGMQEVNQVFFDDVKVPKENLVGELNQGWTCAKYLLEFERGNAYSGHLKRHLAHLRKMAKAEQAHGAPLAQDPDFAAKLAQAEMDIMAMEMLELRVLGGTKSGQNLGAASSMLKTRGTELQQLVTELSAEAVGYYASPFTPLIEGSNEPTIGPDYADGAAPRYLNMRKVTIYAGSNEIQRNIMSKLILGL
ncbi:acyl-CoA dehydrogenase family protein [Ferrovibrio sp.]|jgi:alkylation response protein AidB-like acyl-CoA dehydrogenase|uniref:acyl-CoA dehydrogenase family protein n=1 Tax=Ferrovibrio sp. TaxID=1917215 RepID=UPI0035AEE7BD